MSLTFVQASGPTTKSKTRTARGRPKKLLETSIIVLSAHRAESRLQKASDRRAVVEMLLEVGGKAKKTDIDKHFNFDTRNIVLALASAGWVDIT